MRDWRPRATWHENGDEEFSWQKNGHSRKDVLDDRAAFSITRLMLGTHTYSYLARATHAGMFYASPPKAYLMYAPDISGRRRMMNWPLTKYVRTKTGTTLAVRKTGCLPTTVL